MDSSELLNIALDKYSEERNGKAPVWIHFRGKNFPLQYAEKADNGIVLYFGMPESTIMEMMKDKLETENE